MNDREKRDFQAGLDQEVDAFLRGETTRRTFITRFGQMTGMLAVSGPLLASMTEWALAQQALELADPASPLGQAQAAAMKASSEGPADGSAFRAVEAAKQFSGVTINMTYEVGLQALDPRNFSGPMWEQLTGIKSNVVELSNPDMYSKAVAEHIAGSGAYDVLDISPAWTPSMADGGVIVPLDDYIAKYMNMADLEDYHPLYKALPTYKGKIWGFFDDGDMFALYYRKDIFEDPKMMEAYQAKFSAPLGPPKTWEEYAQIAQFITDQMAPNVYGAGHFRKAGSPGNQFDFLQQFRANGGKMFGDDMKAGLVSDVGHPIGVPLQVERPTLIGGHALADALPALAMAVEIAVLDLDPRALRGLSDEPHFPLARFQRVFLDLPLRADVPAQQHPAGRLVGQHPRPAAYAAVNPTVVKKAADLRLEHGFGDRDLEHVVLGGLEGAEVLGEDLECARDRSLDDDRRAHGCV
jgi:spermidine/putrescine-binding protein